LRSFFMCLMQASCRTSTVAKVICPSETCETFLAAFPNQRDANWGRFTLLDRRSKDHFLGQTWWAGCRRKRSYCKSLTGVVIVWRY
jgi:hypothetical protein